MLRNVTTVGAPVEDIPLRACPFCGSAAKFLRWYQEGKT